MSNIPQWLVEADERWQLQQKLARAAALRDVQSIQVRDSFHTAPGWRDMGMEFSLSEDPAYPRDPAVTAAIKVFDPGIVPLWCRWGFLPPGAVGADQVVVFGRHAIGRWVSSPSGAKEHLLLNLVNQVEFIWEGSIFGQKDPRGDDLPGPYLPWDWRLLSFCRQAFTGNMGIKEMQEEFVHKPLEAKKQRIEQQKAEMAYRLRDVQKYADKLLDRVSEVEMKEYSLHGSPKKSKPFVALS